MTIGDDHLPNYPVTEMVIDTIADGVRKYRKAVGIHNEGTHGEAQEGKYGEQLQRDERAQPITATGPRGGCD